MNKVPCFIYYMQHNLSMEQIEGFENEWQSDLKYYVKVIEDSTINNKEKINGVTYYNNDLVVFKIISLDIILQQNTIKLIQNVSPDKDFDINDLANKVFMEICDYIYDNNLEIKYFSYMGQPELFVAFLLKCINIIYLNATTKRVSIDNPDGTKTSVFQFCAWRNVSKLKQDDNVDCI